MIFVTVGTHEQQLDRLVKTIDELKGNNIIKDEVFIQSGYSTYPIKNCQYKPMLTFEEMKDYSESCNLFITHGGPGSIIMGLSAGKLPIVFPRNPEYNEHVDNHQILFTKRMSEKKKIIPAYCETELEKVIVDFNEVSSTYSRGWISNTEEFNNKLERLITEN
ncbi:glycosyltransferase [Mesobacillus jeotgali]|uniref:Glycosyltransferase n=1 Tax=Mesobacillus jeotgali TaxID=129985 RepID=A0ABY9VFF8_9BACI|nr:glycosyltransferase [Mesobacillus jeotgali]WNF22662.1 glycosyltransferase [Mesobacillus jeotgali]